MISRSILCILMLATWAGAQTATQPQPKNDYSDGKTWLCRPGPQDACAVDLTTTVGDVVVSGQIQADWGLHLIDVNPRLRTSSRRRNEDD